MGGHVVVILLVDASREPRQAVSWHPQKVSCPAEIISDEEVFHRRESCLLHNFYVSYFVLPFDLHDSLQMSHHESL